MAKAVVLRVVGADAYLLDGDKKINAIVFKKHKMQGLCAGDVVEYYFDDLNKVYVIQSICDRRNHIDRPNISNVDKAFIAISKEPQADLFLVDKMLVYLGIENILPYIIISKCDIVDTEFIDNIKQQYNNCVEKIIVLSSKTGEGLDDFIAETKGNISVLVGQSAVGKSSLLNVLGIKKIKVDTIALKVGKKKAHGKNTTKNSELYLTDYNALIADTPGFKMLDIEDMEDAQLTHYYCDIKEFSVKCKYKNCTHLPNNDGCAVVKALNDGQINKDRYNRYIKVKSALNKNRNRKYGK